MVALSLAFVGAFTLLGVASVQLSGRSRVALRVRDAEATAETMAEALRLTGGASRSFTLLADAAMAKGGVRGVELRREGSAPRVRGVTGLGTPVDAEVADGASLRLWVRAPGAAFTDRFDDLLFLYAALTGGVILLLTYVGLTVLIVRPVEALTQASERMARGNLEVEVPARGAKEVARAARSFNRMAAQLRTDRELLEARLREIEAAKTELEAAQEQLVRSARLASIGRLSAGVAHEIGNPLAAILGLVELARDPELPAEDREEFLARIQAETERIHRIIRDLLDFARQDPDEADAVDLRQCLEDALRLVTPQKSWRSIALERDLPDRIPPVRGQPDRLQQVLLNLLLNAADAVDGEGRVRISVSVEDEAVVLDIADDGPGIAEEVRDHLFEPFVTSKPPGEGTGLGLAVSHTIVERLGGSLEALEAPEGGALFRVRFPRMPH